MINACIWLIQKMLRKLQCLITDFFSPEKCYTFVIVRTIKYQMSLQIFRSRQAIAARIILS